ncbi:MAG: glycosyltransferase family 4 protein [Solirubrobacteraceae bacterium]
MALRALGLAIDTYAIRREPISECRTRADREAWETTYALRPAQLADHLRAHLTGILTRPRHYGDALRRAIAMGAGSSRGLARHGAYFLEAVVLWDRCRRRDVRHVHAHFANVASDVALLAARLGGPGFSWSFTMHGPTEFYDVHGHGLPDKVAEARFVVCISDFARSQLMAMAPPRSWDKLHVVHCGVDTDRFSPAAPAAPAAPDGTVRITCVGRLVPEKGQALLLQALARLRAEGHTVSLTVVGDGPERVYLEQTAAELGLGEEVVFRGSVGPDEVHAVLRATDIFCLPSFAEGVPIVLMEAMAMELPVVASQVMGIPELIQDRITGRLIPPGAVDELSAALSELVTDIDLRATLGRAARGRVREEFELSASARQLRSLYERYLWPDAYSR